MTDEERKAFRAKRRASRNKSGNNALAEQILAVLDSAAGDTSDASDISDDTTQKDDKQSKKDKKSGKGATRVAPDPNVITDIFNDALNDAANNPNDTDDTDDTGVDQNQVDDILDLFDTDTDNDDKLSYTSDDFISDDDTDEAGIGGQRILNTDLVPPIIDQNDTGDTIINTDNLRPTTQVIRLKFDDLAPPVIDTKNPVFNIKRKFFESAQGTSYIFKKYWDTVLQAIDNKVKDKNLVTKVSIVGNRIIVNKKQVPLDNILGGEYDIDTEDIVDVVSLLKHYKMIKILIIDSACVRSLITRFGSANTAVCELFNISKNLQIAVLMRTGSSYAQYEHILKGVLTNEDKKDHAVVTRADISNGRAQQKITRATAKESLGMKMDLFGLAKNPERLKDKPPGVITRVGQASQSFGIATLRAAKHNFTKDDPSVGMFLFQAPVGAVATLIGGGLSVTGKVISAAGGAAKSLFNMFNDE